MTGFIRQLVSLLPKLRELIGAGRPAQLFADRPTLEGNQHEDPGHQHGHQAHGHGEHEHGVELVVDHSVDRIGALSGVSILILGDVKLR